MVNDRPEKVGEAPAAIAAIIVNWNGARLLQDCLESLANQTTPVETIVVDNGSTDDSAHVAASFDVRWIPIGRNVGLATAFNVGAAAASAGAFLFLNNDIYLPSNFAAKVVDRLSDPSLGALDVEHRTWDEEATTHLRTRFVLRGAPELGGPGFLEEPSQICLPCAYASGACFCIRADTFRAVGGWDGGYFAGWEDVDLSWRLRLKGYRVEFDPRIHIRHRVSASSHSTEGHSIRTYAVLAGRTRFALKHAPLSVVARSLLRLFGGLAKDAARPRLFRIRLRALSDTCREAPALIRWRQSHYQRSAISPRANWAATAELTK